MDIYNVYDMFSARDHSEHTYADFFSSDLLSLGLSVWPAGQPDNQQPHSEDEVYYVVSGRGRLHVGDVNREVGPGTLAFVAAGVEHRFQDIREDLEVLVFWAPPHKR